jgi:hypothetical protein
MISAKDLFQNRKKTQLDEGYNKRYRTRSLSPSEIITLIVFYHSSGYKTFKRI